MYLCVRFFGKDVYDGLGGEVPIGLVSDNVRIVIIHVSRTHPVHKHCELLCISCITYANNRQTDIHTYPDAHTHTHTYPHTQTHSHTLVGRH